MTTIAATTIPDTDATYDAFPRSSAFLLAWGSPLDSFRRANTARIYFHTQAKISTSLYIRVHNNVNGYEDCDCNFLRFLILPYIQGGPKKQATAKWSKNRVNPVNEIIFNRQIKVWIKHYIIIRLY